MLKSARAAMAVHYTMRVRITRTLHGSIDGIQLDRFHLGRVYDLSVSLACYLMASDAAEPALDTEAVSLPGSQRLFFAREHTPTRTSRAGRRRRQAAIAIAEAAERVRKKPPRRR
jgi:hypothetical protein